MKLSRTSSSRTGGLFIVVGGQLPARAEAVREKLNVGRVNVFFCRKHELDGVKAADSTSVAPTVFPKLGAGDPRASGGEEEEGGVQETCHYFGFNRK